MPRRLNAENFVNFLNNDLPGLLEEVPLLVRRVMWAQLDGAPAHWGLETRVWLNQNFPERWIGRDAPIPWPTRSPDLNVLDFFFWGFLKAHVYQVEIETEEQLIERINNAVREINNRNMLQNLIPNILTRCTICVEVAGAHFEQLLWQKKKKEY